MKKTSVIAVIPARGGSKRIPKKNIKLFFGKPLISYTINILKESELFDEIFVSTDSREIANIAQEFGAKVPFLRSADLSEDHSLTVPVIADFIKRNAVTMDSVVCCAYATAPLMRSSDLRLAYSELFNNNQPDYVCAVSRYDYPIQRALKKTNGIMNMAQIANLETLSQEFEPMYHDAGQFYFAKAKTWEIQKPMLVNTFGVELPSWRVQDIDTLEDWQRAELLYKVINSES
jgi:pseudaminic acid cytidylyltransferase